MKKLILFLMLVGVTSGYFLLAGQMDETPQYISMGAILFLLTLFLFTPSSKQIKRKKPAVKKKAKQSEDIDSEGEGDNEKIPEPVRKGVEDGVSLRERKLAKLAEKEETVDTSNQTIIQNVTYNINDSVVTGDMSPKTDQDDDGEVEVISDEPEYHTAQEYVVEVDADSIEEANIERFVADRAERHRSIRKRIEERRRGQMAEIRASTAKMWDDQDDREDLISILSKQGHGLNIFSEPEKRCH